MEKKRFLDFLDMFDGGGAGQMGDKFEGGGLLSMLGNAFGSPYGSEDPERRAARQAFYGSDQIGGGPMSAPAPPQVMPAPPTQAQRFGLNTPAVFSAPYSPPPAGPSMNPANAYGPVGLTFQDFVAGLGPVAQSASPDQLMTAYRQHMQVY